MVVSSCSDGERRHERAAESSLQKRVAIASCRKAISERWGGGVSSSGRISGMHLEAGAAQHRGRMAGTVRRATSRTTARMASEARPVSVNLRSATMAGAH
jgi:hypothetical protein